MARPRVALRQALIEFAPDKPRSTRTIAAFGVASCTRAGYSERHMTASFLDRRVATWCLVLAVFSSGCAKSCAGSKSSKRGEEESVTTTSNDLPRPSTTPGDAGAAPSCGREVQLHGQGYDAAARKCLWDAYQAKKPAGLSLTRHTIEGDPITFTLRVLEDSSIEVVEDNQDRFGARGVRRSTCKTLEQRPSADGRSGFVLSGCVGGAEKIEVP